MGEKDDRDLYIYMGIFGGAILVRVVCWLGEKRIFESACIALAFLGMASLRFGEWRYCLGRHGMVYQMELF